jgi:uncharacterized protein involved in exopolysaccharide biosynthesis/Mrp family chromosome partitioning ATPase
MGLAKLRDEWEHPSEPAPAVRAAPRAVASGIVDPQMIVAFIKRRFALVLLFVMAALLLAVAAYLFWPIRYTATALVYVDPREARVTTEEGVFPGVGGDPAAIQSFVELATADGFLRPVVEDLDLAADPEFAGADGDATRLVDTFRSRLGAQRRGATYIVEISFTSSDAEKAARIANVVAESFVMAQQGTRSVATAEVSDFLGERLDELRENLRASEAAVAAFRVQYGIVQAGGSTSRELGIAELGRQVAVAQGRTEEARARYEQVQRDGALPQAGAAGGGSQFAVLDALRTQYAELSRSAAELDVVYGSRHPRVQAVQTQLRSIEAQIAAEGVRMVDVARAEFEAAQQNQMALAAELRAAETESGVTDEASVQLRDLERQADANRNLYEEFLGRYKLTDETRSLDPSQARVVSPAVAPTRSNRPGASIFGAAGMVLGVVLGTSAALVAEAFVRGFAGPAQVERSLGIPVGAEIPLVKAGTQRKSAAAARRRRSLAERVEAKRVAEPTGRFGWLRRAKAAPAAVEDFLGHPDLRRHVRRLLRLLRPAGTAHPADIVLVTSPGGGEGKSAIALSLAALAAETGLYTLLIRPQAGGGPGLAELLSEEADLEKTLLPDQVAGIDILPVAAPAGAGVIDLYMHARFAELLEALSEDYDFVVIDGPNARGDEFAGLVELCDAVVLALKWRDTDEMAAEMAVRALGAPDDQPVYAALNMVEDAPQA